MDRGGDVSEAGDDEHAGAAPRDAEHAGAAPWDAEQAGAAAGLGEQHDELDRRLLRIVQGSFALAEHPYAQLARSLSLSEPEALARVERLLAEGVIRRIAPEFDPRALGYATALVAGELDSDQLEGAAQAINSHPGVFRSAQLRSVRGEQGFNLLFTLAIQPGSPLGLERTLEKLEQLSGARELRALPALRLFKQRVALPLEDRARPRLPPLGEAEPPTLTEQRPYDRNDVTLIQVVQGELPLTSDPYRQAAARLGMPALGVVAYLQSMEDRRLLRRVGATLRPEAVGLRAHGVAGIDVPAGHVAEAGAQIAARPEVAHCSERQTGPRWPYPLLVSVQARSWRECAASFAAIAAQAGARDYAMLEVTRELKHVTPIYFSEDFRRWEREHAGV